ncbi:hypothetical protein BGX38DRAFT_1147709 [Terfezia claveryi]|nr:hypothetical protein BGX38DRAFT_1147709 [Terfezia claveryi]
MENVNIHSIKSNHCPVCIVSLQELGILQKKSQPIYNYMAYENLYWVGDLERLDRAVSQETQAFSSVRQDLETNPTISKVLTTIEEIWADYDVEWYGSTPQVFQHVPKQIMIGYIDLYLRKFHDNLPVFTEFWVMKKDYENVKEASRELAADQLLARQAKLDKYFELSAIKRMKIVMEERQERQ